MDGTELSQEMMWGGENLKRATEAGDFIESLVKEMKVLADEIDRFLEVAPNISNGNPVVLLRIGTENGNKHSFSPIRLRRRLRRDPASLHYAVTSKHADIEKGAVAKPNVSQQPLFFAAFL